MRTKFKEILKERNIKEECERKFGKYLFGEFKEFYGDELEKDTPIEKEIWNKLSRYIRGEYNDTEVDKKLKKIFFRFKRLYEWL